MTCKYKYNPFTNRLDRVVEPRLQGTLTPTGTTETVDFRLGDSVIIDLESATGDVTLTLSNPKDGYSYVIKIIQGATPRDVVWPGIVKWDTCGGTPVVPTTEDHILLVSLYYDGTNYFGGYGEYT